MDKGKLTLQMSDTRQEATLRRNQDDVHSGDALLIACAIRGIVLSVCTQRFIINSGSDGALIWVYLTVMALSIWTVVSRRRSRADRGGGLQW